MNLYRRLGATCRRLKREPISTYASEKVSREVIRWLNDRWTSVFRNAAYVLGQRERDYFAKPVGEPRRMLFEERTAIHRSPTGSHRAGRRGGDCRRHSVAGDTGTQHRAYDHRNSLAETGGVVLRGRLA